MYFIVMNYDYISNNPRSANKRELHYKDKQSNGILRKLKWHTKLLVQNTIPCYFVYY